MKPKFILLSLVALFIIGCKTVEDPKIEIEKSPCKFTGFRYYKGEQLALGEMFGDYILIGSDTLNSEQSIRELVSSKIYFDKKYDYTITKYVNYKYKLAALKLRETMSCEQIAWIIEDLNKSQLVDFAHYTMQTDDCDNDIWESVGKKCVDSYSTYFYVKVKNEEDISDLKKTAAETNTFIEKQDTYMKNWYLMRAEKNSAGDAMAMANYFFETGLFDAAEPDIIKIAVEPL